MILSPRLAPKEGRFRYGLELFLPSGPGYGYGYMLKVESFPPRDFLAGSFALGGQAGSVLNSVVLVLGFRQQEVDELYELQGEPQHLLPPAFGTLDGASPACLSATIDDSIPIGLQVLLL